MIQEAVDTGEAGSKGEAGDKGESVHHYDLHRSKVSSVNKSPEMVLKSSLSTSSGRSTEAEAPILRKRWL